MAQAHLKTEISRVPARQSGIFITSFPVIHSSLYTPGISQVLWPASWGGDPPLKVLPQLLPVKPNHGDRPCSHRAPTGIFKMTMMLPLHNPARSLYLSSICTVSKCHSSFFLSRSI